MIWPGQKQICGSNHFICFVSPRACSGALQEGYRNIVDIGAGGAGEDESVDCLECVVGVVLRQNIVWGKP